MTEPRVLTEIDGPVAYVWLNRPDKLNGVELDMLQGLLDAAAEIRRNRDLRVVVLQGKGDSFCAGLDFAAAGKSSKARLAQFFVPNPLRGTNLLPAGAVGLAGAAGPGHRRHAGARVRRRHPARPGRRLPVHDARTASGRCSRPSGDSSPT